MSCIYKGEVIDTNLSQNAKGGTEMMRERIVSNISKDLLENFAIHLSRPRKMYEDVKNIFYCHDLVGDPENKILRDGGWNKFDHFVFVSQWQRDQYVLVYGIPYSKCTVIPNAIEKEFEFKQKSKDTIEFIYHTTPHRGLELVYPIFDALSKQHDNIHLDVFSSFGVYGWKQRDEPYKDLFKKIEDHPNMSYHGAADNQTVLNTLDETHIFMYPCIWQETSCIALIEAIRSGVVCIHPNYGALTETASGASIAYEYTEDINEHANRCMNLTSQVISLINESPGNFEKLVNSNKNVLPRNGINSFTKSWNGLLEYLSNV